MCDESVSRTEYARAMASSVAAASADHGIAQQQCCRHNHDHTTNSLGRRSLEVGRSPTGRSHLQPRDHRQCDDGRIEIQVLGSRATLASDAAAARASTLPRLWGMERLLWRGMRFARMRGRVRSVTETLRTMAPSRWSRGRWQPWSPQRDLEPPESAKAPWRCSSSSVAASEPLARVAVANEGISERAHFGSNPKLPANSAHCTLDGDERIVGAREDFGEVAVAEVAAEQRSHEEIGGLFGECLRPSRRRSRSETEVVDLVPSPNHMVPRGARVVNPWRPKSHPPSTQPITRSAVAANPAAASNVPEVTAVTNMRSASQSEGHSSPAQQRPSRRTSDERSSRQGIWMLLDSAPRDAGEVCRMHRCTIGRMGYIVTVSTSWRRSDSRSVNSEQWCRHTRGRVQRATTPLQRPRCTQ